MIPGARSLRPRPGFLSADQCRRRRFCQSAPRCGAGGVRPQCNAAAVCTGAVCVSVPDAIVCRWRLQRAQRGDQFQFAAATAIPHLRDLGLTRGSMLLWVLMLAGWSAAVAQFSKQLPDVWLPACWWCWQPSPGVPRLHAAHLKSVRAADSGRSRRPRSQTRCCKTRA